MKVARIRLLAAVVLFAGWLGYLGYLAFGHSRPVVVSHSQMLIAPYVVKAQVEFGSKAYSSARVLESFGRVEIPEKDFKIDLSHAKLPDGKQVPFHGTETLLLLLERSPQPGPPYQVVHVPNSSGAPMGAIVYPWSDEVERQVREQIAP